MDTQRLHMLGISGSLKKDSSTLRAIKGVLNGAAEAGAETRLLEPDELRLPLFDDRSDPQSYEPEVARFLDAVRACCTWYCSWLTCISWYDECCPKKCA